MPYVTTNCSVHLNLTYLLLMVIIEMLISQWIWLRKGFRIKAVGSFSLTVGFYWCIWHIFPRLWHVQQSHIICSWMMANNDWKITDIISLISWKHVRKHSQKICNILFVDIICIGLYMLVSVTYSAIIYMCNCGVIRMRLSKMVRYLYNIILITQITLCCVVKFKQTTVICNKRYVSVAVEFDVS